MGRASGRFITTRAFPKDPFYRILMKPKLLRITTVPVSLGGLLKGQHRFMSKHFEVVGISSSGMGKLKEIGQQEGIRVYEVEMTRKITPFRDLWAVWKLFRIMLKEKPQMRAQTLRLKFWIL